MISRKMFSSLLAYSTLYFDMANSPLGKSEKSLLFRFSPTFEGAKFFSHKRVEKGFVKTIQVVVGFRKCPKVVKLRGKERYLSLNFEAGLTRSAALWACGCHGNRLWCTCCARARRDEAAARSDWTPGRGRRSSSFQWPSCG